MKSRIDKIWEELESDQSFSDGLLLRRYSPEIIPDVFVALFSPENFRCIAACFSGSVQIDSASFSNLRDIKIDILPDKKNSENKYLIIKLLNFELKDIFGVLCEDLILSTSTEINESKFFNELLIRFEKWKDLFDRVHSEGLSPEEQRGLFGELYFLRKFLTYNSDFRNVILSWTGPENLIRDYQFGKWSVEVKTTCGNNHQKLHISSERQLDTKNLELLFLYHLSLEHMQNSGESLCELVDSIISILESDYISLKHFNYKLSEAGYLENHLEKYSETVYFVREEAFYTVEKDFPRLEELNIRQGVGDVKYSIIVSQCFDYKVDESKVFQVLLFR